MQRTPTPNHLDPGKPPGARRRRRGPGLMAGLCTLVLMLTPAVSATAGPTEDPNRGTSGTTTPRTAPATPEGEPRTADSSALHTWWHDRNEARSDGPVAPDAVRMSDAYDVDVSTVSAPDDTYDSFAYMSMPRSGKEKEGYDGQDGAEFASSAGLTMSWSTFEAREDTWVTVRLTTGATIDDASDVTVRPTELGLPVELVDPTTVRVKVPYSEDGTRISVEFAPELVTAYNDMEGVSGNLTLDPTGNRAVHTEPGDSLMIFAQPMLDETSEDVPTEADGSIRHVTPGSVRDLDTAEEEILVFGPGEYDMGTDYHAQLPPNVRWVYLAPGAYVKGAFRFVSDEQDAYKVTGYGVLSGERYVYEADTREGYQHRSEDTNCHADCVKMLQFASKDAPQHLDLHGITIAEPPYHSFVVYGNEDTFTMDVSRYQQVGSWYWQTDGIELYSGSRMRGTFFHANDDVLKLYHSDVRIEDTVIWKNENGPVVQWGWGPRDVSDVVVRDTAVIHNRMGWKDVKNNTCILNSSSHWEDMEATDRADPDSWVRDIRFEGIEVEGMVNCAFRVHAMASTEGVRVDGLHIDRWNELDPVSQASFIRAHTDTEGRPVAIGDRRGERPALILSDYRVDGKLITRRGHAWGAEDAGRIDMPRRSGAWDAVRGCRG